MLALVFRRIASSPWVVLVLMAAGVLQYALVTWQLVKSGQYVAWALDPEKAAEAGMFRFVKDAVIVGFGLVWPVAVVGMRMPAKTKRIVEGYALWIMAVVSVGLLGFLFSGSPTYFLAAGFRWLAILHASVGLFVFAGRIFVHPAWNKRIFWMLTAMLSIHFFSQILELMILGWDMLGKARLTGLFQHAAVGANFALACVLIGSVLQGVSAREKAVLFVLAFFSTLATGTRSASFAMLLLVLIRALFAIRRPETRVVFSVVAAAAGVVSISAVTEIVGRGNPFLQQFDEGGRIGVFFQTLHRINQTADIHDILIGKGFGVGTNTGYSLTVMKENDPTVYAWNWLTDNLVLPIFFQTGALGTALFFGGIAAFLVAVWPRSKRGKRDMIGLFAVMGMMGLAGAPWEHYYLMASYALVLGMIFWRELGYANGSGAGPILARR